MANDNKRGALEADHKAWKTKKMQETSKAETKLAELSQTDWDQQPFSQDLLVIKDKMGEMSTFPFNFD